MTLKEKIAKATIFAWKMKVLATRLEYEAEEDDCKWSNKYVSEMLIASEELLKQLQGR